MMVRWRLFSLLIVVMLTSNIVGQIESLRILLVPMPKELMLTDYYTKRIFDRQNTPLDSFFNAAYNETVNVKNYCMHGEVWRSISEIEDLKSIILTQRDVERTKSFYFPKDSTKKIVNLHNELSNGKRFNARILDSLSKQKLYVYAQENQYDYVVFLNSFDIKTRKPFESKAHVSIHAEVYRANGVKVFGGKSFYPIRITKRMFVQPMIYFSKRAIQLYVDHLIQLMIKEAI
jgi:hypothetical protein